MSVIAKYLFFGVFGPLTKQLSLNIFKIASEGHYESTHERNHFVL